ncbi:terminase [candidate division KSB1 bacterium RBG_16_48_16]|nr:MAG: terminase [candidate division KSB1 bacterium RBG_16_48_16]
MPKRSAVTGLPREVKEWLDKALIEGNFSGYEALEEDLRGRGYAISKSGIHRYGKEFKEKIEGIKKSTEMAKMLAAEAGDDEGALNDALVRILQDKLFNLVMELEINPAKINVASLSRSIADLARASISQKKFMAEVRTKSKAVGSKIEALEKEVSEGRAVTLEALKRVREDVYGMA